MQLKSHVVKYEDVQRFLNIWQEKIKFILPYSNAYWSSPDSLCFLFIVDEE